MTFHQQLVRQKPPEYGKDPFRSVDWDRALAIGGTTIAPRENLGPYLIGDVPFTEWQSIKDDRERVYIVGEIRYRDVVSQPIQWHQTQLLMKVRVDFEGKFGVDTMGAHNCADDDCDKQ